ncbi:MAG: hypothetical protein AAF539_12305, partial [Planctomycetota bacterium]
MPDRSPSPDRSQSPDRSSSPDPSRSTSPASDAFASLACEYDFVPVYRRLFSDTLTPVTAFMHLDDGESAFLIESVIG